MSSPHSASSIHSLINQALGVSGNTTSDNFISKALDARTNASSRSPQTTYADFSIIASPNETRSGPIGISQHPLGNITEAASTETSAGIAPQHLQFNTFSHQTPLNNPQYLHLGGGESRNALLFSHTFTTADTPVRDGYEALVSSMPIALFIPPRHIPELWIFPAPQSSDDLNSDLRTDPYTLQRYLAESYTEDPYPFRCRLQLRGL
ncbi:hypothetical protein TWF106_004088 [Orbilia oligospora]|uniref:Uncharacterized protein n=1 Tax=Orbilia oligospora TaxID=2813651 RepID=A0A7C8PCU8_ORBOL|nr:hypothetical protein TWF788_002079 [Orbilia oligospora]KAF3198879.1 hypothetical protein TWF106_004088 [Orbilia oligospora]KAF3206955.1 hypothetical protein TWF679_008518 [Orbilia oligospora]